MTYTARATLEIGSGSVCSGRAVTTTTASNQVCFAPDALTPHPFYQTHQNRYLTPHQVAHETRRDPGLLYGHLLPKNQRNRPKNKPEIPQSEKLMNALLPKKTDREDGSLEHNLNVDFKSSNKNISDPCNTEFSHVNVDTMEETNLHRVPRNDLDLSVNTISKRNYRDSSGISTSNVDKWYKGLANYDQCLYYADTVRKQNLNTYSVVDKNINSVFQTAMPDNRLPVKRFERYQVDNIIGQHIFSSQPRVNVVEENNHYFSNNRNQDNGLRGIIKTDRYDQYQHDENDIMLRKQYRKQISSNLAVPTLSDINPRNLRPMTIGRAPETPRAETPTEPNKYKVNVEQIEIHSDEKLAPTSSDVNESIDDTAKHIISDVNTESGILKCIDTVEEYNKFSFSVTNVNSSDSVKQTEAADGNNGIELTEFKSSVSPENVTKNTFADFFATQQELLNSLNNLEETGEENEIITTHEIENIPDEIESDECIQIIPEELITTDECVSNEPQELTEISDMTFVVYDVINLDAAVVKEWFDSSAENNDVITNSEEATDDGTVIERMLAEIPNNSFIFLTVPQPLIYPAYTDNTKSTSDSNNNDSIPVLVNEEKEQPPLECPVNNDTEEKTVIDKNALKVLLLQNLFKNNIIENPSGDAGVSAITGEEVGFPELLNSFCMIPFNQEL